MPRIVTVCLVCLLLAGCTAPTAQSPATTADPSANASAPSASTPNASETTESAVEDGYDIPVTGGSLPVEHERVFARTERLLGANVSPPTVIVVQSQAEISEGTNAGETPNGASSRSFVAVMGIGQDESGEADGEGEGDEGDESEDGVSVAAYAPSANAVYVNERMTRPGREQSLERTMAHEFVHTVQFRQDAFGRTQRALDLRERYSRDRYLTYASVIEGAAVFVASAYDRRYLEGDWASITTTEGYRSADSGVKYAIARYYFGSRYLEHRFGSPRNLSAVYDDPPETTEQLLHNDTDGSEEPKALSVSAALGENRTTGRTDVNGELFTRIALGTELNRSRAVAGADGWGADRLVPVVGERGEGNRSYVWATRWDSPAEADEFEAALGAYLESRANRSGEVWRDDGLAFRVERASDETVVLLAGDEPFVGSASVAGTNASVSVASE